jgi:hypothetical protein
VGCLSPSSLPSYDIAQSSNTSDLHLNHIAWLYRPNALWCSRGNHIGQTEGHALGELVEDVLDAEDAVCGCIVLHYSAIEVGGKR